MGYQQTQWTTQAGARYQPGRKQIWFQGTNELSRRSSTNDRLVQAECEMRKALVCGAGGFIGGHLVKRLKKEGFWVRGVDLKFHEHAQSQADDFVIGDLRDQMFCRSIADTYFDEVYQLAADMGGAGYIFTGLHDADIMHNSA